MFLFIFFIIKGDYAQKWEIHINEESRVAGSFSRNLTHKNYAQKNTIISSWNILILQQSLWIIVSSNDFSRSPLQRHSRPFGHVEENRYGFVRTVNHVSRLLAVSEAGALQFPARRPCGSKVWSLLDAEGEKPRERNARANGCARAPARTRMEGRGEKREVENLDEESAARSVGESVS